jgi:hypothetical protein
MFIIVLNVPQSLFQTHKITHIHNTACNPNVRNLSSKRKLVRPTQTLSLIQSIWHCERKCSKTLKLTAVHLPRCGFVLSTTFVLRRMWACRYGLGTFLFVLNLYSHTWVSFFPYTPFAIMHSCFLSHCKSHQASVFTVLTTVHLPDGVGH